LWYELRYTDDDNNIYKIELTPLNEWFVSYNRIKLNNSILLYWSLLAAVVFVSFFQ
jgi:hypothetical protein